MDLNKMFIEKLREKGILISRVNTYSTRHEGGKKYLYGKAVLPESFIGKKVYIFEVNEKNSKILANNLMNDAFNE